MTIAAAQFGAIASASGRLELSPLERATTWLNSQPLSGEALQGKVVLVEFWTYTCINWRRQLPYVRAWAEKYKQHGLIVVGVHSPEFSFERDVENVRWAAEDMRVDYPIAVDSDHAVWRGFHNEYWPALYWFSAAVRTTLADAGYDGWGAAATASSAALGGLFFLLVAVVAIVVCSIAGSGNHALTSGLNDFVWAGFVLTSFPRAMMIMSSAFGLWRARQISNALYAAGVAAVVLVLLGGTTWLRGGLWAPNGVYSRFVSPAIGVVWGMVVSGVLLRRSPATRAAW